MRVLIAGGGTGGHVIPGLAIAREMRDRYGAEVRFVGTARGLEARMVPEAGFGLELIHVGPLKNVSVGTRLRTLGDLPRGMMRCVGLLRRFKPSVVVGVGGYASGPAMGAAVLLGIPTLAYEPNAVPGLANRLVGKRVSAAAVNFAGTADYFRNAVVTGVPVRRAVFSVPVRALESAPGLLVTAGSQGARIFNEALPTILVRLLEGVPGLTVVHQAGARHVEATTAAFAASGADPARWAVRAFVEDMPGAYAAADLVLCRAGSTVAELAAAGRPSLLVPFAAAADDHQRKNAEVLVSAGAAVMVLEREMTEERLLEALVGMLGDRVGLRAMGERARTLAHPEALERIGAMCFELGRNR